MTYGFFPIWYKSSSPQEWIFSFQADQLVCVGMSCVFDILRQLSRRDPELCVQALNSLMTLLQVTILKRDFWDAFPRIILTVCSSFLKLAWKEFQELSTYSSAFRICRWTACETSRNIPSSRWWRCWGVCEKKVGYFWTLHGIQEIGFIWRKVRLTSIILLW